MSKVDMPNSITCLNRAPIFEWYVVWCDSKNKITKRYVFKKDWTTCLNMITILDLLVT